MLELLVTNAAKAIMAERHKFLESGSWEKATSIARSNAEAVRPGTKLHKLALTSKGPGATSCISNPIGSSNSPDPGKTRANISLMMGAAEHGAGTLEGWQLS